MAIMLRERLSRSRAGLVFDLGFSIRARVLRWKASSTITLFVATASVALAAGVEVAYRSASIAVAAQAESIQGRAELEVTAGEAGIGRQWLGRIRELPEVKSASAVVDRAVRPAGPHGYAQQIYLIGFDLSYDRDPREFSIVRGGYLQRDLSAFRQRPGEIAIPARLAAELGVSEGERVRLRDVNRDLVLTVGGILRGALASAWDGRVAVGDIEAVQHVLGTDKVSRIDLVLEPSDGRDDFMTRLQREIGDEGSVRPARFPNRYLDGMMSAYMTGIWTVVLVGLLIALLMSFCISSDVVERRAAEFRLLRAVGMSRRRLRWLVVLEAGLLAIVSSALGLSASRPVGSEFVKTFSMVAHALGGFGIDLQGVAGTTVIVAFVASGVVVIASSIVPAFRAAQQAEESPRARPDLEGCPRRRLSRGGRLVAIGSGALIVLSFLVGTACGSTAQMFAVIVAGVACAGSACCYLFSESRGWATTLIERGIPRVGHLVAGPFRERPVELAIVVTIWATAVGGTAAVAGVLEGAGVAINGADTAWRGATAIIGFPEYPERFVRFRTAGADPAILETIASTEGVESASAFKVRRLVYRGEDVLLYSIPTKELVAHGGLESVSEDPAESIAALLRGECLASWVLADRFGMKTGDAITLPAETGVEKCRVGGRGLSLRGGLGAIMVDDEVFNRWFTRVGLSGIYVWPKARPEDVVARLEERTRRERLGFSFGRDLSRLPSQVLARWSEYVVVALAAFLAIGVLGLLAVTGGTMPEQRARLISAIRLMGGTRRTVIAVLTARSIIVGSVGSVAGIAIGILWGRAFVAATHRTFGWEHPWPLDLSTAVAVCVVALPLSVVASGVAAAAVGARAQLHS